MGVGAKAPVAAPQEEASVDEAYALVVPVRLSVASLVLSGDGVQLPSDWVVSVYSRTVLPLAYQAVCEKVRKLSGVPESSRFPLSR